MQIAPSSWTIFLKLAGVNLNLAEAVGVAEGLVAIAPVLELAVPAAVVSERSRRTGGRVSWASGMQ